MSSESFVPAENSKLAEYGRNFQEMKKTEAGRELLDYFNTADRNCYVRDSRGRAGTNGEETLRGELRGWTIFIDRKDVDSRKIPTTSGTDQSNLPMRTHYDANVPESAILQEVNGHFFPRSSYQNESGGYYYYYFLSKIR